MLNNKVQRTDLPSPNKTLQQLNRLKQLSHELYTCVDVKKALEIAKDSMLEVTSTVPSHQMDFEDKLHGGRGELYREAQRNPMVRAHGIKQLFTLVSPENNLNNLDPSYRVLDVLGGDGTLTRALSNLVPTSKIPAILTSDIAEGMIDAAQEYGLSALRQPAHELLLRNNCFDATLIAYGSHHIPLAQRPQAIREMYRILKPGGKIVFHDFEEHSPVARWFTEVVDRYSSTGHDLPHFSREEIQSYLVQAGFTDVIIRDLYDPFILALKETPQTEYSLGEYLLTMYGLTKFLDKEQNAQAAYRKIYTLACQYFQYDYASLGLPSSFGKPRVQIFQQDDGWYIEMPRLALVGTAVKPGEE